MDMKTVLTEFQNRIPNASQIKQYISENDPDEKMLDEWLFKTIYEGVDWLEKEKHQIIDFASKCQLVRDVDCDGNVTFCFNPKEHYDKTFS